MKIHAHHGTNAVCGCWSKCVAVGVGSINSSVTVETRRDGQITLPSWKSLLFYVNTNVIQSHTTPRTEATTYGDDISVFGKWRSNEVREEKITWLLQSCCTGQRGRHHCLKVKGPLVQDLTRCSVHSNCGFMGCQRFWQYLFVRTNFANRYQEEFASFF